MISNYTEIELRGWFRENAGSEMQEGENAFVTQMFQSVFRMRNSDVENCSQGEDFSEFDEDTKAAAQLLLKFGENSCYVKISSLVLCLFKCLFANEVVAAIKQTENTPLLSRIVNVCIDIAANSKDFLEILEGYEYDFCKYLIENKCTYIDQIRRAIHPEHPGFSIDDAVDDFCNRLGVVDDAFDEMHHQIEKAVRGLIVKNILSSNNDGSYYLNL